MTIYYNDIKINLVVSVRFYTTCVHLFSFCFYYNYLDSINTGLLLAKIA